MTIDPQNFKKESPRMFNAIAGRYDFLNYVLSFGLDIGWRRRLVGYLPAGDALRILDLATGTADVAITLARCEQRVANIIGVDLAEKMLDRGRVKVEHAGLVAKVHLQPADALALLFADNSFDAVTVAFGLRNMPDLMLALREARRVLRPQGRLIVLEFSKPENPLVRAFHTVYLHGLLPLLGGLLTGNYQAYRYLSRTIRNFPCGLRFERIMAQVGLSPLSRRAVACGAATIYVAEKKA